MIVQHIRYILRFVHYINILILFHSQANVNENFYILHILFNLLRKGGTLSELRVIRHALQVYMPYF